MSILLACIMVVSIACSLFYGAASFAYLDLYEKHKYFYEKAYIPRKSHKKLMRYNLLCYRHAIKRFIIYFLICITSLIVSYLTL